MHAVCVYCLQVLVKYKQSKNTLFVLIPFSEVYCLYFRHSHSHNALLVSFFSIFFPVDALYRTTYPEYLQYIYLVAPVSLMFLNPIGFALCEVQRWRQASGPQRSTLSILGVVVLQVLFDVVVILIQF